MKKFHIALIALFLAVIILPAAFVFAGEDRTFSDNENRMLQTAPKLTFDSILDGSFQNKITDYISDQFPARDTWTQLGSQVKKLAGFKDIGGAYLGSDGYYMEKITPDKVDETNLNRNIGLVSDFVQACGVKTTMLLVPATGTVMSDKLPAHARMYDAEKLYNTVKSAMPDVSFPDLYAALSEAKTQQQVYYGTALTRLIKHCCRTESTTHLPSFSATASSARPIQRPSTRRQSATMFTSPRCRISLRSRPPERRYRFTICPLPEKRINTRSFSAETTARRP